MDIIVAKRVNDLLDTVFTAFKPPLRFFYIHPLYVLNGSVACGCFEPPDKASFAEMHHTGKPFYGGFFFGIVLDRSLCLENGLILMLCLRDKHAEPCLGSAVLVQQQHAGCHISRLLTAIFFSGYRPRFIEEVD